MVSVPSGFECVVWFLWCQKPYARGQHLTGTYPCITLLTILPEGPDDTHTLQRFTDTLLQTEQTKWNQNFPSLFTNSSISTLFIKHRSHAKCKCFPGSTEPTQLQWVIIVPHLAFLTSPLCSLLWFSPPT